MNDPATGPIPRDKFAELMNLPFGQAAKKIRQYDPLWGRAPGEKIEWKVVCRRRSTVNGVAFVEATSEKEAKKLAENLGGDDVDWDYDDADDFDILEIEATDKVVSK